MLDPGHRAVQCRCDCGTERAVLVFALRNGNSPSCGCIKRELAVTLVSETRWKESHGRAAGGKDPLYRLWLRINRRCHDQAAHNYRWYGARGISVWPGWRHDAGAFIAYIESELGPRPEDRYPSGWPVYSLDRIDNDGNYEPGNTQIQQVRKRHSVKG